jgi:hypothetical protein
MNSSQRRRLYRLTDSAAAGHAPSRADLRFLQSLRLPARLQLALAEDLSLHIDTGELMTNITEGGITK